jgi:hypothetical protein
MLAEDWADNLTDAQMAAALAPIWNVQPLDYLEARTTMHAVDYPNELLFEAGKRYLVDSVNRIGGTVQVTDESKLSNTIDHEFLRNFIHHPRNRVRLLRAGDNAPD